MLLYGIDNIFCRYCDAQYMLYIHNICLFHYVSLWEKNLFFGASAYLDLVITYFGQYVNWQQSLPLVRSLGTDAETWWPETAQACNS